MIRRVRKGVHGYIEDTLTASRATLGVAAAEGWELDEPHESAGDVRRALREVGEGISAATGGRRTGSGGKRAATSARKDPFLSDQELADIEQLHAEGITAAQVVDLFVSRGLRFSEATFRKYVQQGLLPRSRRVGRKGKHRGSLGVYPAKTVRRVNSIKRLMAEDFTIEEIQSQFLRFTDVYETLEDSVADVFAILEEELEDPRLDPKARRVLDKDIRDARKSADELLRRLESLSARATGPRGDHYRDDGAAGSAEDLL